MSTGFWNTPRATVYHVTWTGKKMAEEWDRRAHEIAPHIGLGWTPYTIRITKGAISEIAFHKARELRRWLNGRKLRLVRYGQGIRIGTVKP